MSRLEFAVDFPAVSDPNHQDGESVIVNLVDDPIVSRAEAVKPLLRFQHFASLRARVIGQCIYLFLDSLLNGLGQLGKSAKRAGQDRNLVGHL